MPTDAVDPAFTAAFRDDRAHILGLATRWLGERAAAEDVTQEAFSRLATIDVDELDDVRGWLAVVVRRLCLDRMRSAYARRETAAAGEVAAPFEPTGERSVDASDPLERITLDDEVQLALAVVLDQLSPAERTAFVLHDVFGFTFADVGEIVGRTEAACRQLASRARRTIRSAPPGVVARPVVADEAHHRAVVDRFIAACAGGDLQELMAVLDPDVVGDAHLLGHGPIVELQGRPFVAERLLAMFGPRSDRVLVPVDWLDRPAAAAFSGDHLIAVVLLDVDDDRVHTIHSYVHLPDAAR